MSKRREQIVDNYGEHIAFVFLSQDSVDLEHGNLEGLCAPGISTLSGRSFAGSLIYGAMLQGSDLSGCNFEQCDMRGSNLMGTLLIDCNFAGANLGLNSLDGATQLQGANLTGSNLVGCSLQGATYDSNTKFPIGFEPDLFGMACDS